MISLSFSKVHTGHKTVWFINTPILFIIRGNARLRQLCQKHCRQEVPRESKRPYTMASRFYFDKLSIARRISDFCF